MIYSVKAVVDCYKSYEIPLVVSLLPKGLLMENAFIDTRKDALGVRLSSGGGFRFLALAASVGNHFFQATLLRNGIPLLKLGSTPLFLN